jgi:branched-chain amino acid transport system ATP-binding protein
MLEVRGLKAGYGSAQVLHGVDLEVAAGEVVALLGRNGMGKTTIIRCLIGLLRPSAGSIRFMGVELTGKPAHRIAQAGLGLVPEGRQVFPNLTVREHLAAFARRRDAERPAWEADRVLALFPRLAERADAWGRNLSGGEQQMLAIGRALVTNPRLLLLDEATEGLAPMVRAEIWRCLDALEAEGLSILLIDKPHRALEALADRQLILEKGRVVWQGSVADLRAAPELRHRHLGV